MIHKLEPEKWLELNAKLQQKKNAVRKSLKERGVLKREGVNTFDKYKYFSEAQYKTLFTELLSEHGLEIKFDEIAYDTFEGTAKQSNGRMPKLVFTLIDIDTGFYEDTTITGEGMDKGDKAGYKAYTGALKYFFADTFLVATGDDPETESPDEKMNNKKNRNQAPVPPSDDLYGQIHALASEKKIPEKIICERAGVNTIEDMPESQALACIKWILKGARA